VTPDLDREADRRELLRLREWLGLAAALALAAAVRVSTTLQLRESPFGRHLAVDEGIYHQWALALARGEAFPDGAIEFSPFPAWVFAAALRLFGESPDTLRFLNAALGTMACAGAALLAHRLAGRRAAIVAALLTGLSGPLVLHSAVALKTSLVVVLFAAFALLALRLRARAGLMASAGLGLVAGGLMLSQGHALLLAPLGLLFAWRAAPGRRVPRALVFALAFAACLLPVARHNYAAGVGSALPTQGGFNLYLASRAEAPTPFLEPVPFATQGPREQSVHFLVEAERRTGRRLNAAEASRYWSGQALVEMARAPGLALLRLARKAGASVHHDDVGDHFHLEVMKPYAATLRGVPVGFAPLFALAVVGLWAMPRRRDARTLALVAGVWLLSLAVLLPGARYRAPVLVVLAPLAAAGLSYGFRSARLRQLRLMGPALALGLAALALTRLPTAGSGDTGRARNVLAVLQVGDGDDAGAEATWRSVLVDSPRGAEAAGLALAQAALRRGDLAAAAAALGEVPRGGVLEADRLAIESGLAWRRGQADTAVELAARSLEIRPGFLEVAGALARMLEQRGEPSAAAAGARLLELRDRYSEHAPFARSKLRRGEP
jgi:4-amino-4-deoxy-L-arabinose transferase-like glycosyltransferase